MSATTKAIAVGSIATVGFIFFQALGNPNVPQLLKVAGVAGLVVGFIAAMEIVTADD